MIIVIKDKNDINRNDTNDTKKTRYDIYWWTTAVIITATAVTNHLTTYTSTK